MAFRNLVLLAALGSVALVSRAHSQASTTEPPASPPASEPDQPGPDADSVVVPDQDAAPDAATIAPEQTAATSSSESEVVMVETGVIEDPELSDSPREGADFSSVGEVAPFVPTGDARLVLQTRVGVDTHWGDPREDIAEATQIMLLETRLRRSENLRFVAGLRARHLITTRERSTPEFDAVRHSLDIAPTAAYADITVKDGVYVRAGYQVTRMGRFDAWSATNFLAVADLRSGANTLPDALDVAQLAARLDWDPNPWLHIQVIHVPFFQPHLVDLFEGDYAMFPTPQATGEPLVCDRGATETRPECLVRQWTADLSRSGNSSIASGAFAAFGTSPSLANPQGAIRATIRGLAGELSLTAGTALEHLPMLIVDRHAQNIALVPNLSDTQRQSELGQIVRPIEVVHNRFFVFSTDGAMPVGPVQLGFEAAYMLDRTLYAAQTTCSPSGLRDENDEAVCLFYMPVPERSDMLHTALRAELAQDESLLIGVEGFFAYALNTPSRPDRYAWLTLQEGRFMTGVATMVRWSPLPAWTFEVSGAALAGPTWFVSPRIQWRAAETLFAELGGIFVDGGSIPTANPMVGAISRVDWAIGGMFAGVDQVFAGLKWTP